MTAFQTDDIQAEYSRLKELGVQFKGEPVQAGPVMMAVFDDMRAHDIEMLTVGQYLQPSKEHFPLQRYVHPDEFKEYEEYAYSIGFKHVASGPMVRSSYHADRQAKGEF